jgi:hypothetical protein
MARKPAKKITAKKPADPVVVLEEWGTKEYRHRLVYSAETNKLYTINSMFGSREWVPCLVPHIEGMPV